MMRVLIVDDERPIREWIAMCLKNLDLPIEIAGSAANGKEAYEIFCERPLDVIITDIRMPVMDGLELMKRVKQRTDAVSFIILTCHEEFSYAREAMKLGIRDYLLKTEIDQEQLGRIFEKLLDSRRKRVDEERLFLERQSFVYSVFSGSVEPDEGTLRQMGIYKENRDFFVAMLALSGENRFYRERRELKIRDYACFYFLYEKNVIVILVWMRKMAGREEQIRALTEFSGDILRIWAGTVGISAIHAAARELPLAFEEAKGQLEQGFYEGEGSVNLELLRPCRAADSGALQAGLDALAKEIYGMSRAEIRERFLAWLDGSGRERSMKVNLLKEECIFFLNRLKEKYAAVKVSRDEIIGAGSFAELRGIMAGAMDGLLNLGSEQMVAYVREAVHYIEQNYSQNLRLETVAKHVCLNPDYFSRLFKSNTGQTFNNYLTGVRMEAAKRMLADADMTIGDVAARVGYQNIAYFSKVFKKYTGRTPFDYKK